MKSAKQPKPDNNMKLNNATEKLFGTAKILQICERLFSLGGGLGLLLWCMTKPAKGWVLGEVLLLLLLGLIASRFSTIVEREKSSI